MALKTQAQTDWLVLRLTTYTGRHGGFKFVSGANPWNIFQANQLN